ncbi:hypothetical protein [Paenibacillus marinisediminis]
MKKINVRESGWTDIRLENGGDHISNIDKRDRLSEEVFSYKTTKDNKVFIYWKGKQVTILSGKASDKFLKAIEGKDHKETQLVMAKITGNFKRGNEKDNKSK